MTSEDPWSCYGPGSIFPAISVAVVVATVFVVAVAVAPLAVAVASLVVAVLTCDNGFCCAPGCCEGHCGCGRKYVRGKAVDKYGRSNDSKGDRAA